ncbi:MAG TPA: glycoside hydrolase family 6 protein [Pseudonocardiaceae bacterium]|nr:glycoside hydrolase family 6 protein [Pseudonocardiaceae bacterium]
MKLLSMRGRPRQGRLLAAGAAVIVAAGLATVAVTQANAASTCSVQYQVQNDWGAGATVNLNITNNGPAITSWTLAFTFPGNQHETNGWNGTYSQSGANLTVTNLSYNGSLATGASTSTGFNLSETGGAQPAPTTFTLNGAACAGGTPPPPTTTTNPPPTTTTGQPPTTTTGPPPTTTTTPPTTTTGTGNPPPHLVNPFVGAAQYLNPDYVKEIKAQAATDGSAAEASVATWQTGIWMDKKAAIAGDSTHMSLTAQMDNALAQAASGPVTVDIVIYDLPGRDCAALASNGEIPATAAGLTDYETNYINPIANIFGQAKYVNSNIRVIAIIEPDSLPNAVTNTGLATCQTSAPLYEQGITYALNKLHAIPNVYNYIDAGHSGWLGWPSNLPPGAAEFAKVAKMTTAQFQSVDGFISSTANYSPVTEPFIPNPTLQVGGQPLNSGSFYQFNPFVDEHSYDIALKNQLVSDGFSSNIGMLIDTSRDGWGGPARPTALNSSPTTPDTYVAANKIDQRSFRGDWCNQNGAGIGARPQAQPFGASDAVIAFVWIKPPGESDGDYPTATHAHGDPHCDPNGTNTDNPNGTGNVHPTGSIPGFDIPAGQFFPFQFQQLVANAFPKL